MHDPLTPHVHLEWLRTGAERTFLQDLYELIKQYFHTGTPEDIDLPSADVQREYMLSRYQRFTPQNDPGLYNAVKYVQQRLGLRTGCELYRCPGRPNAENTQNNSVMLIGLTDSLRRLLDEETLKAVLAHEAAHFALHACSDLELSVTLLSSRALHGLRLPSEDEDSLTERIRRAETKFMQAQELSADRASLLVCRDLKLAVKPLLMCESGCSAANLDWDIDAYINQCVKITEGMISCSPGASKNSHPLNVLRTYALKKFWDSDEFYQRTGLGANSVSSSELDAKLLTLLDERSYSLTELNDLPKEVIMCALAVSVLTACSDGTMSSCEVDAIEETFARQVPTYREYLDADRALELFANVHQAVLAMGLEASHIVFIYASHVLMADEIVNRQELDCLENISDSLNCRNFWLELMQLNGWIGGIISKEEWNRQEHEHIDNPLRMPESREIDDALKAYLESAAKLGSTSTTMRRLSTFANISDYKELLGKVENLAGKCRLSIDPAPDILKTSPDLDGDTILTFTAPHAETADAKIAVPKDQQTSLVIKAINKLRSSLISGDGRSPSIRCRKDTPGRIFDLMRLNSVSPGHAERTAALLSSGRRAVLFTPAEGAASEYLSGVSKDLERLAREAKLHQEEHGAAEVYLGTDFVTGSSGGFAVCAPLVLLGAELKRIDGMCPGWEIIPQEKRIANMAVLRAIADKKGIPLTDAMAEQLAAESENGAAAIVSTVISLGLIPPQQADRLNGGTDGFVFIHEVFEKAAEQNSLSLEPCAALGFFPQSSSELLNDYTELLAGMEAKGSQAGSLLNGAAYLLPADMRESCGAANLSANTEEKNGTFLPMVQLDPSQRKAVEAAEKLPALVVDGPPGTGKSQVIVGLVLEALRNGKKAAVVSDKRAALDVVAQRLAANGFGSWYALVHNVDDDRKEVYERINRKLEEPCEDFPDEKLRKSLQKELEDINSELVRRHEILCTKQNAESPDAAQIAQYAAGLRSRLNRLSPADNACTDFHNSISSAVENSENLINEAGSVTAADLNGTAQNASALFGFRSLIDPASFWGRAVADGKLSDEDIEKFGRFIAECSEAAGQGSLENKESGAETAPSLGAVWLEVFERLKSLEQKSAGSKNEAGSIKADRLFAPWDKLNEILPRLISYQQSFLRFFSPGWYSTKGRYSEWMGKNCPELILKAVTPEWLRDLLQIGQDFVKLQNKIRKSGAASQAGFAEISKKLKNDAPILRNLNASRPSPSVLRLAADLSSSEIFSDPQIWTMSILYAWGKASFEQLRTSNPELDRLSAPSRWGNSDELRRRLGELENQVTELEKQHLKAEMSRRGLLGIAPAEPRKRRTEEQKIIEELKKETAKKSRRLPMRTLVRRYAEHDLMSILPVWLLSPETITTLFPRQPVFDIIIFDEASQSTTANSIPALLRTKHWVIAGDDKQMPPTSFFKGTSASDDADILTDEETQQAAELFDSESLLTLARIRAPHIRLLWHYRCQHESLIAFSNYAFYQGTLATIPSPAARNSGPAIIWETVSEGLYEDNQNIPEAEMAAQIIRRELHDNPDKTIGVITFNIKQRMAILNQIDKLASADGEFAQAYAQAMAQDIDRRPFVKNLENVQGDERDTVIFSPAYAPVLRERKTGSEYKVPARFGPLGQKGGERRLNVAVSRAKTKCIIVASFSPEQLSVGSSKNCGPRLFKLFLEFAKAASEQETNLQNQLLRQAMDSSECSSAPSSGTNSTSQITLAETVPVEVQLAVQAEKIGFTCEQDVGSGSFKIPLVLNAPGMPPVAILIDKGSQTKETPYDLCVHRPRLLRSKGWLVRELTPVQWLLDQEAFMQSLKDLKSENASGNQTAGRLRKEQP